MCSAVRVTCLLWAAIPAFASAAVGQGRIVDTARTPYNLADCLLRGWPRGGEWVTHEVTLETQTGGDKPPQTMNFIMQAELIPTESANKDLHWLEVTFRSGAKEPPAYVLKLLVDRSKAQADEWNLSQQKLLGWEKRGVREPAEFTAATIRNTTLLGLFIDPGDQEWVKRPATDVKFKSGALRCDSFMLKLDEPRRQGQFACQLHPSVPFGCVRLHSELQDKGETKRVTFQLTNHGTGARSDLPEHDFDALVKLLAKPDE